MVDLSGFVNYELYSSPSIRRYHRELAKVKLSRNPPYSFDDFTHFDSLSYCGHTQIKNYFDTLNLTENSIVLDVCAGIGATARFVNSLYGCNVVSVDYIKEFIELSDEINKLSGATKIRSYAANATEMNLAELGVEECCDLVYSLQSFYYIRDKQLLFSNVNKALNINGILYIEDHVRLNDLPLTVEETETCKSFSFIHQLTKEEYTPLLEAAGFEILFYENKPVEFARYVYNRANTWLENREQIIAEHGEDYWDKRILSGIYNSCRLYHDLAMSAEEAKYKYQKLVEFIGESEFKRWLAMDHKFTGAYIAAKKIR